MPLSSPELIIERLNILKEGVETRAITPREFSAERDVIIEALMSPTPRQRIKNRAPSKNILDAAQDLRRLERVCRDACQQGRHEMLVAALEGQMSGLLLKIFPHGAPVRALRINESVLSSAFGDACAVGDPWPDEPLKVKGGLAHV